MNSLTDVLIHVFATDIGKIAEGAKSESHKLVVEGIEFAQWRSVEVISEQSEAMFKRTGARDELANQMGKARGTNFEAIEPMADWIEQGRREGRGESSHSRVGGKSRGGFI